MNSKIHLCYGSKSHLHISVNTGVLHIDEKYKDCCIWFVICCPYWHICQNQIQYQIFCSRGNEISELQQTLLSFSLVYLYPFLVKTTLILPPPQRWKRHSYCYYFKDWNYINIATCTTQKMVITLIVLPSQREKWKIFKT